MLPEWPPGTVTILSTSGEAPHAIPVSAAVRAGPRRVLVALAAVRESLARLRADPRVALTILSEGDVALTAHGRAVVVEPSLVEGVVAVEIDVDRVHDHNRPTFVIDGGVNWRWTDPAAAARDAEVRAALQRLVAQP
jgi:Pyridoxamine 5'-phosphate oxidase